MNGNDLRAARRDVGLSRLALARRLGYTERTIASWERGEYPVPREQWAVIEALFTARADAREREDAALRERLTALVRRFTR
jgi:transcriptional regulator with XRE-family HTH domain